MTRPPRPRPSLTVDRIVDVAADLADRDGFFELTLTGVADTLGVRTPSLYNHVGGLDDLRRLLTVRALTELGDRLRRAAVGRTAEDAVRAMAAAYRAFAHEHPGLYATTVPSSERGDPEVSRAGSDVLASVLAALDGYGLDGDRAVHATRAMRSAVHGFVTLELGGGFGLDVDTEASFDWLTDLLADGIRARAGTWRAPVR